MHVHVKIPGMVQEGQSYQDVKTGARHVNLAMQLQPDVFHQFLALVIRDTYTISQRLVPVDTSMLKSSGYIKKYNDTSYEVGYLAPYAPYVHEILHYYHQPPTQAKFLTEAFMAVMSILSIKFGSANLPDFNITYGVEPNLYLRIDANFKSVDRSVYSWRRLVPL